MDYKYLIFRMKNQCVRVLQNIFALKNTVGPFLEKHSEI
jgi:hypothetical protein